MNNDTNDISSVFVSQKTMTNDSSTFLTNHDFELALPINKQS